MEGGYMKLFAGEREQIKIIETYQFHSARFISLQPAC